MYHDGVVSKFGLCFREFKHAGGFMKCYSSNINIPNKLPGELPECTQCLREICEELVTAKPITALEMKINAENSCLRV